jgi:hypothetical protein
LRRSRRRGSERIDDGDVDEDDLLFSIVLFFGRMEGKAKTWRELLMNIEYELSDKLPFGSHLV